MEGVLTWVHPLHAIWVYAVRIAVIPPYRCLAQAIRVGDVTIGVQVVASLAWVCDDCMRRDERCEGEEETYRSGEEWGRSG